MGLYVEVVCVAELYDSLLERYRSLLVRVGTRYAVAAVNLCIDEILFNVDVFLYVLDRLFVVGLCEAICLDERTLKSCVCVGIAAERRCLGYLTAARLILECLLVCAVVNYLVALRLSERGVRRVCRGCRDVAR